jgi:ribonuclease P protein component
VLYTFPREGGEPARVGLSVGRKVGGAVARNQVKRLLREACALHSERLPTGHDVVLAARPEAQELASERGLDGIAAALGELLTKTDTGGSKRT